MTLMFAQNQRLGTIKLLYQRYDFNVRPKSKIGDDKTALSTSINVLYYQRLLTLVLITTILLQFPECWGIPNKD